MDWIPRTLLRWLVRCGKEWSWRWWITRWRMRLSTSQQDKGDEEIHFMGNTNKVEELWNHSNWHEGCIVTSIDNVSPPVTDNHANRAHWKESCCVFAFIFHLSLLCCCWVLVWSSAEAAWVSDPVLSSCPLEVGPTWARLGGNSPQSTSGQSRTGTTFPLHPLTKKIQSRTFALSLWVVGLAHSSVGQPRAWGTTCYSARSWVPKSDFVDGQLNLR